MDQSICPINAPIARSVKVDQRTPSTYLHSLRAPCADASIADICNALVIRLSNNDDLSGVMKDTLFNLFVHVDTELESRANSSDDILLRDLREPSEYRSTWSDDELDEAHMVRSIHAECFNIEGED